MTPNEIQEAILTIEMKDRWTRQDRAQLRYLKKLQREQQEPVSTHKTQTPRRDGGICKVTKDGQVIECQSESEMIRVGMKKEFQPGSETNGIPF